MDLALSIDGCRGQCKLNRILQGQTRSFPGNASTMEYFHAILTEFSVKKNVAIIDEERQITFDELERTSTKFAIAIRSIIRERELKNYNPNNDWVIALCLPPSDKLIFTMFAIHKLGAAYLPIDHTFSDNRVISIVTSCRPIIIISDSLSSTFSKFEAVSSLTETVTLNDVLARVLKMEHIKVVPFPSKVKTLCERVAVVMYTSGSSGSSKGVRLTHRTIMNRLSWQWEVFPYTEDEKCCFKTAFTFVDSVAEIFGPLLRGIAINIFSKLTVANPVLLIKKLNAAQITRITVVPALLRALISTLLLLGSETVIGSEHKLDSIRLWVCSGETLTRGLLEDYFMHFPTTTLCNFYGSTETMADVTYEVFNSAHDIEKQVEGIHVPIGIPIHNTILYVLNEQLQLTPEGETGELYVAGHNLCSGYVGMDNADKFFDNPFTDTIGFNRIFKTGDFVRIGTTYGQQRLFYKGGSESQVKVRGHKVDLLAVEGILSHQEDLISRAYVLCYNPGKEDQALVVFAVPANERVTSDSISVRAKATLRSHEIPEVRLIAELPLTLNGKLDRHRLLSIFENERRATVGVGVVCGDILTLLNLPPELIEQGRALIQVIAEVTHIPQKQIIENFDDSFFNLGGTSLNCVVVVTKLRMKKLMIALDDFVSSKSLRDMLRKMAWTVANKAGTINTGGLKHHHKYYTEFLAPMHEIEATAIIAYSFSRKGDLEAYTNASYQDFKELLRSLFPLLQKKGFSFIVRRREDKKMVAVSLNFDLYDEPTGVPSPPAIQTIFDFLDFIEQGQKEKVPKGRKKVLHCFMMGTHEVITEADNVPLIKFVEEEITRIAKDKKFIGVFTTNTNPLAIQLCSEIFGYETLLEYQINQYREPDGSRPFRLAPDEQVVNCCWKKLHEEKKPPGSVQPKA